MVVPILGNPKNLSRVPDLDCPSKTEYRYKQVRYHSRRDLFWVMHCETLAVKKFFSSPGVYDMQIPIAEVRREGRMSQVRYRYILALTLTRVFDTSIKRAKEQRVSKASVVLVGDCIYHDLPQP